MIFKYPREVQFRELSPFFAGWLFIRCQSF